MVQILTNDGSVSMTGNFDLSGNNLVNVNNIDGSGAPVTFTNNIDMDNNLIEDSNNTAVKFGHDIDLQGNFLSDSSVNQINVVDPIDMRGNNITDSSTNALGLDDTVTLLGHDIGTVGDIALKSISDNAVSSIAINQDIDMGANDIFNADVITIGTDRTVNHINMTDSNGDILIDSKNSNKVKLDSDDDMKFVVSGRIDCDATCRITEILDPSNNQDAATKSYVDNNTSDTRFKTNIQPVENATPTIKDIDVIEYDFSLEDGERRIGIDADSISNPVVETRTDIYQDDGIQEGVKSYNWEGLYSLLIRAFQELEQRVTELENAR